MLFCSKCEVKACYKDYKGDRESMPKGCPSKNEEILEKAKALYLDEENMKIAHNAALVESGGYGRKTRLEETIDFMHRCGYKKIGLAFCYGLRNEAKTLTKILEYHDFEVCSVMCKCGAVPKKHIDIKPEETVHNTPDEVMCNPIGQALFLNEEKVDFTLLFGLCVGHDTLCLKYLDSPVSVFAVKDRVLAHNPVAAIYQSEAYYKSKIYNKK